MKIEWVQTGLATLALVWVAFAWHRHDNLERRERLRVEEIIETYCATVPDGPDFQVRPAHERERLECEIAPRHRLGGRGAAVSGNVDVSGSVALQP